MTDSPPHGHPEIRLSVTDGDSVEAQSSTARSSLWSRLFSTRRRALIIGAAAVAVLLGVALGADYFDRSAKAEPVKAMESFLRAVNDGDIDEAYTYMSDDTVAFHRDYTLDPTVFSSEWDIGDIELVEFTNTGDHHVTVSAEILAQDGTGVTEEFLMHEEDDNWVVTMPYSNSFHVSNSTFEDLEVNGRLPETPNSSNPPWFYLLPGAYEIGLPDIEFMEAQYQTVLFLGKQHSMAEPITSTATPNVNSHDPVILSLFDLREDSDEEAQRRVNEYLESCVSDSLSNPGCPISLWNQDLSTVTGEPGTAFEGATADWNITEFPEVFAVFDPGTAMDSWIGFENQTPGQAELTVTGTDNGVPFTMTIHCGIGVSLLEPTIGSDGKLYISPLENPHGYESGFDSVADMDCEQVE